MPGRSSFDYAVVRVVPRVERGERINTGVILYCRERDFLGARIALDRTRLLALDAGADVDEVERALALIPLVCSGDARAGAIGRLPLADRFHWLTAPRSTIVQDRRRALGPVRRPGGGARAPRREDGPAAEARGSCLRTRQHLGWPRAFSNAGSRISKAGGVG